MMLNEVKSAFHENRLAILISAAVMVISIILGYFLEPYLYSYLNPVVEHLIEEVESGAIKLAFADIFLNNLKVIIMMFVCGVIFCFSALILSFNGFFVGYYAGTSENLFEVLLYIVPHGIFELSSCVIACASGFVLFNFACRFLKALWNQENDSLSGKLKDSYSLSNDKLRQACILFVVSVVLMMIAGFIETYLTIPIARFVLSILG